MRITTKPVPVAFQDKTKEVLMNLRLLSSSARRNITSWQEVILPLQR
jgi:hypothetical protein